jgi:hypothetical protein
MFADTSSLLLKPPEIFEAQAGFPETDKLVCAFPLAERAGSGALDVAGGLHGTLNGFTDSDRITSLYGPALRCGTGKYINVPHDARLNLSRFSFGILLRRGSTGTRQIFFGKGDGNAANSTSWWGDFTNADVLRFYLSTGGGVDNVLTTNFTISDTDWHFLVFTWDGQTMRVALDGKFDTAELPVSTAISNNTQPLAIGRLGSLNALYFDGDIAHAFLFDRALSDAEVATLHVDPWLFYRSRFAYGPAFQAAVELLAGTSNGAAALSATLRAIYATQGTCNGASTHSAALRIVRACAGQSNGAAAATLPIVVLRGLGGQSGGAAANSANLAVLRAMAGVSAGQGSAAGALGFLRLLEATAGGAASASAALLRARVLASTASGAASVLGSAIRLRGVQGTAFGNANVAATMRLLWGLRGNAAGAGNANASLRLLRVLRAQANGAAGASGNLVLIFAPELGGAFVVSDTVAAQLLVSSALDAVLLTGESAAQLLIGDEVA